MLFLSNRGVNWTTALIIGLLSPTLTWSQIGGLNAEFAGGGARALAMGGAFIGLADDATAVEFNPAGLWQLRRPEVAFQLVYTHDRHRDLLPSSLGDDILFDSHSDEYVVPSFASFVYPMQHLVLGVSEFTNVFFDREISDVTTFREEAENYTFGLTVASSLFSEQLSIGTTLRYNVFRWEFDDGTGRGRQKFTDESPSINVGLMWQLNRFLSVGSVYKSTQELKGSIEGVKLDTKLPDTLGVGFSFSPNDNWRLLFDVDHIWWSKFDAISEDTIERDDVWRYHLGTEWYAGTIRDLGVFFRSGYWYEESNALGTDNPFLEELFDDNDPVHHYTFGIGLAKPRYQIDLGIDLTEDKGEDFIASVVYYF